MVTPALDPISPTELSVRLPERTVGWVNVVVAANTGRAATATAAAQTNAVTNERFQERMVWSSRSSPSETETCAGWVEQRANSATATPAAPAKMVPGFRRLGCAPPPAALERALACTDDAAAASSVESERCGEEQRGIAGGLFAKRRDASISCAAHVCALRPAALGSWFRASCAGRIPSRGRTPAAISLIPPSPRNMATLHRHATPLLRKKREGRARRLRAANAISRVVRDEPDRSDRAFRP